MKLLEQNAHQNANVAKQLETKYHEEKGASASLLSASSLLLRFDPALR